jgi:hypothetical protein
MRPAAQGHGLREPPVFICGPKVASPLERGYCKVWRIALRCTLQPMKNSWLALIEAWSLSVATSLGVPELPLALAKSSPFIVS